MQDKDKVLVFQNFARKAAQRLEERKKMRRERLYVKSIEDEVEIRGLSDAELNDCMEFSDDPLEVDKYTVYYASPTLQEAGKLLVADGTLKQEYKIMNMFTATERRYLVNRVLELSGATGEAGIEPVKETEELKNS